MTKSLGQVAFEAYPQSSPFDWDALTHDYQSNWQAAADAVVNRYIVVRSHVDRAQWESEERAVIEVARAVPHEIKSVLESLACAPPENYRLHYARLVDLANAMYEALQKLEKGDE